MRVWLVVVLALLPACVSYDLSTAPSKDLGVGHLYERLPAVAKVATFRGPTGDERLPQRLLMRCTDAFTSSLRRTDVFESVVLGGGDAADVGFEGTVARCECHEDYAFVWAFYSVFAIIAIPANLPIRIDDADYDVTVKAIQLSTGRTLGTYRSQVHLHSWRGAYSLFETFLEDPGQVFDLADRELLEKIVDDYQRFRAVTLHPASAQERPGGADSPEDSH
jgi:hypothetical protein